MCNRNGVTDGPNILLVRIISLSCCVGTDVHIEVSVLSVFVSRGARIHHHPTLSELFAFLAFDYVLLPTGFERLYFSAA